MGLGVLNLPPGAFKKSPFLGKKGRPTPISPVEFQIQVNSHLTRCVYPS